MSGASILIDSGRLPVPGWSTAKGAVWTLYYYEGNFYYPLTLPTHLMGRVKRQIREWSKDNAERIAADQSHPEYKTKLEIYDDSNSEEPRGC
jgi:hypothetical protein